MYVIKKINVDGDVYMSSQIANYTNNKIAAALILLEMTAKDFVREEIGRDAAEQSKIIDILSVDQINEPLIDTILLYRLSDDPQRIHVYQRKTVVSKESGIIWGERDTVITKFKRTVVFEIEECVNFKLASSENKSSEPVDMVPVGPAKICVPKPMTIAPMCDVIDELKKSSRFQMRFAHTAANMEIVNESN